MIIKKYAVLMNAVCAQYYSIFVIHFIISVTISSVSIYFRWYLERKCIEKTVY